MLHQVQQRDQQHDGRARSHDEQIRAGVSPGVLRRAEKAQQRRDAHEAGQSKDQPEDDARPEARGGVAAKGIPILRGMQNPDSMELGTGNMDLDGLKEIALANGIEAVVSESHKNWIDRDPVKSLEKSAEWLKERF